MGKKHKSAHKTAGGLLVLSLSLLLWAGSPERDMPSGTTTVGEAFCMSLWLFMEEAVGDLCSPILTYFYCSYGEEGSPYGCAMLEKAFPVWLFLDEEEETGEGGSVRYLTEEDLGNVVDIPVREVTEKENIEENVEPHVEPREEKPLSHQKAVLVNPEQLRDYDTLVKTCYAIDSNTEAGPELLDTDRMLARDFSLNRQEGEEQILIYHTHSQEGYADSDPTSSSWGVMGVGEELAGILREEYGYGVLHYEERYDVESRDDAYSKALPDLERVLSEHPGIQVVIDLHRDEMPEQVRLVTEVDGRPTARFMFFNGLSHTRKTGDIAYLHNDNLEDNLAFSLQLQLAAMEYYPGLTRKIYLKGYRYNMHLKPRNLLIELGAQNNTEEEAHNACAPLAQILDRVLSGQWNPGEEDVGN